MKRIALLIETSRFYGRSILRGIARYSHIRGPLSLYSETAGTTKISFTELKDWEIDGIIARDEKLDKNILSIDIPLVVYISRTEDPYQYKHRLIANNTEVGEMAAEHFLEKKYCYFGYCGFADVHYSNQRCSAFVSKLAEYGFEVSVYEKKQAVIKNSWEKEQIRLCEWLDSIPKPAAVFACIDERARHVSEACKRVGLKVPEDIAILGVDNDPYVCDLSDPPLSSIAMNAVKGGFEATEFLIDLIKGEKTKKNEIIIHPMYVQTRRSTDILAVKDTEIMQAIRYIRQNSMQPIQVSDVASKVALSRRTLEKKFYQTIGRTIHEEIKHARVEKISQILLTTNIPIQQIAYDMGFNSANNLSRYYKQIKGITCRKFRKTYGNIDINSSIPFNK
jgi:LacI family transcriptional regulator